MYTSQFLRESSADHFCNKNITAQNIPLTKISIHVIKPNVNLSHVMISMLNFKLLKIGNSLQANEGKNDVKILINIKA